MNKNMRKLVGYAILIVVLLFFYLFTPSYYVRYISLFFIGTIVLSFLYSRLIPLFITVERLDDVIRGIKLQDMTAQIVVKNRSPVPISYFTVEDMTGELFAEQNSFLVNLRPLERRVIRYTVKGHRRGEYHIGPVRLKGNDPLGFFDWTKRVASDMRAIVYPSIYPMDLINTTGLPAGNINVNDKMYEDVTQFRSLREYVPGDDMKRINWKASAKTAKLYTMEFDSTLYFPVLIVLNFCFDDYVVRLRNQMVERAAEIAASLAFYFANLKQEIGFVATGTTSTEENKEGDFIRVQGKSGYEHAQEILEVIAKLRPVPGRADFNSLLFRSGTGIQIGTKVMVVTPRVNEEQAQTLIGAKRKGLNLQVLQLESSQERRDEDFVKGALRVIPIKEMAQGTIHEQH